MFSCFQTFVVAAALLRPARPPISSSHNARLTGHMPVMGLRQRVRAWREIGRLLEGVRVDANGAASDAGSIRRLRVRLRRSKRRVDASVRSISADVEAELADIPPLSLNNVRRQLAAAMSQEGMLRYPRAGGEIFAGDVHRSLKATAASDLRRPNRRIAIVTTAALPWMTVTSVNPLLRAAGLAAKGYAVDLVIPWLEPEQQPLLFPPGVTFSYPAEQEEWVWEWLRRSGVLDARAYEPTAERLHFRWYPAVYEDFLGAVIQQSRVDLTQLIPPDERDVCTASTQPVPAPPAPPPRHGSAEALD